MNQIFSVVWSEARQKFIVASEFAGNKGQRRQTTSGRVLAGLTAALLVPAVSAGTLDWYGEGASQTTAGAGMVIYHDNASGTDISALFPQSGATSNTVNIYADVAGSVYGGFSPDSTADGKSDASGNTVSLFSGNVSGDVYGGRAESEASSGGTADASASHNAVSVSGGTVQGTIDGGSARAVASSTDTATGTDSNTARATADTNTVTVSGAGAGTVTGASAYASAWTSYPIDSHPVSNDTASAEANDNQVIISGSSVNTVLGAYAEAAATAHAAASADGNAVSVSGATIQGGITGGSAWAHSADAMPPVTGGDTSATATASSNTVAIAGSTLQWGEIKGGDAQARSSGNNATVNATASSNSVTISDSTLSQDGGDEGATVYGGYAVVDDASSVSGATGTDRTSFTAGVTADSNVVTMTDSTAGDVYGGYAWAHIASPVVWTGTDASADTRADTSDNLVTLSGGAVDNIYGGDAWADASIPEADTTAVATAEQNNVTVTGSRVQGDIHGGRATVGTGNGAPGGTGDATASGNTVTVSDSTVGGDIYGGEATTGTGNATASNNTVTVSGATAGGDIYGGYATTDNGVATASDNTVILEAGSSLAASGSLYGGKAGDSGTSTGNLLDVRGFNGTVASISDFQQYRFEADMAPSQEDTFLTVTAALDFSGMESMEVDAQYHQADSATWTDTLVTSETGISNFNADSVTITGAQADYLTPLAVEQQGNSLVLETGLSWYSNSDAGGVFTLTAPQDTFTLNTALNDVTGNAAWDGKSLAKEGDGTLVLAAANTYSGDTRVDAGTLWLTDTGVIGVAGSTQNVTVADGATLGGSGVVNGSVTSSGNITVSQTGQTGNTLTINGNYTGNEGSLTLNTQLADDSSPTDKLVVNGDTAGTTTLYINNTGGAGALTDQGIEVVDVSGTSGGTFTQGNQVQAGLYEYRLYQDDSNGDWYLRSQTDNTPDTPQYRADTGAYLGNQWMARNLQMQTLSDREGSQLRSADGSVWARFKAGSADSTAANGNVDINNDYSQFQLGGDVLSWSSGTQSLAVGLMGSYISADTDSEGNQGADGSRFSASGNVEGYNLGLYATWFADTQTHRGLYVDSWYQYGTYNNSIDDGDAGTEDYDSTANAVSLETGWRHDIALANGNSISLTPQAQVVWQNYHADNVTDNNGTRVDGQNGDNLTTRLGLRVDGKLHKDTRVIQPFMEANWLYTRDAASVSFDDASVDMDLPSSRVQLKAGIQATVSQQWSVTAQVAGEKGSHDYDDLSGSLNLHYNW